MDLDTGLKGHIFNRITESVEYQRCPEAGINFGVMFLSLQCDDVGADVFRQAIQKGRVWCLLGTGSRSVPILRQTGRREPGWWKNP